MGLRRGWPDFLLIAPRGLVHCLELKRIGELLSEDQNAFATWCTANNVPHVVACTIEEALEALECWGALRLKIVSAGLARTPAT